MQKRARRDTALCVNYCAYFKPGKNEDLACQGFLVVHGILRRGKRLPLGRPERTAVPDDRTLAELKERVCAVCSFRESDCDYVLSGGTAVPCGGFALLSHLLGTGDLRLRDID